VELRGELVLAQQLGDPAGRGDVSGGQRGEGRGVDVLHVTARGDELTILVDDEDDLGVRFPNEAVHDPLDLVELLLVHHHLRVNHYSLRRLDDRCDPKSLGSCSFAVRWRSALRGATASLPSVVAAMLPRQSPGHGVACWNRAFRPGCSPAL